MPPESSASSNPGNNHSFNDIVDAKLSRRALMRIGLGGAVVGFFAPHDRSPNALAGNDVSSLPFQFEGVPASRADEVIVPNGYEAKPFYPWGHPVNGESPAFEMDASNDASDQAQQAGMGHDGMEWFPNPGDPPGRSDRGLLAMNHEYADQGLLFTDGITGPMTAEKVRKSQAAHGVSIIAVQRDEKGAWNVVPSRYSRRITATTPMRLTGPAAGSRWVITAQDPSGTQVSGTFNNCACGITPWGTYLTCEENFHGVFGTQRSDYEPSVEQRRYGLTAQGHVGTVNDQSISVYRWWEQDERFDLEKHPHEANRFGYVVEIDPTDVDFIPRKHTALGRFKHENAAVTLAADGRVVVYMGDDERNEYIYKFVSTNAYDANNRVANRQLLEQGTLYVARFDEDGTGKWLELTFGHNGLVPEHGFEGQADIAVRTRQAADRAGATMMDRPEWLAIDPQTGQVFATLTNNSLRGKMPTSSNLAEGTSASGKAQPPVDAANPRSDNIYGHIVRWTEHDNNAAATQFTWSHFLLAGDPQHDSRVTIQGDSFGSPDGLRFDRRGILWIQTDASASVLGQAAYENLGNNMMLAADPISRTVRRFLTGPVNCEITGMTMTPDGKTMFVNIQHPGEPESDVSDPRHPTAFSTWPDGLPQGRPRSSTVAIQRRDGGLIGD